MVQCLNEMPRLFPAPDGVLIVSTYYNSNLRKDLSVPWRGVDCFSELHIAITEAYVSVPWRGVDCFFMFIMFMLISN